MPSASGERLAERADPCPVCGGPPTKGRFCGSCGFECRGDAADPHPWPSIGDAVQHVELRAPLASPIGARRYLGADEGGTRYEVLVTPQVDPEGVLAARAEARAALDDMALEPSSALDRDGLRYTFTVLPDAPSLLEGLTAILADRDGGEAIALVERWIAPLARAFARLHAAGHSVGDARPGEILIDADGRCVFRSPPRLWPLATTRGDQRRRAIRGFAAPEVRGRCDGRVGAPADVFFVGISMFYALARIARLTEAGESPDRLPPPHIYHDDVPAELAAVVRRATSPVPERRYADAGEMLGALEQAMRTVRRRRAVVPGPLPVDIGHELHIGVLKGQYAPTNQDDLFLAYHGETGIGLFLISDGVSISEHGTGDMASSCVRHEALDTWRHIVEGRVVGDELDDMTLDGLGEMNPVLPESADGRQRLLQNLLDSANGRIGRLLHQTMPRFVGPPEGIMAATAVAVLLRGNHATLCSIGDSRIYLIRDGHIASLMVDHDLATQLMRMGRPPTFARNVQAAAALIRCVGEFEKDADDQLVPVPLHPEFLELDLLPGDTLVLTSDGIPDYAGLDEEDAERRIREVVQDAPGATWAAFELMVTANRGGGGDNISCIVLRFAPDGFDDGLL